MPSISSTEQNLEADSHKILHACISNEHYGAW